MSNSTNKTSFTAGELNTTDAQAMTAGELNTSNEQAMTSVIAGIPNIEPSVNNINSFRARAVAYAKAMSDRQQKGGN